MIIYLAPHIVTAEMFRAVFLSHCVSSGVALASLLTEFELQYVLSRDKSFLFAPLRPSAEKLLE